ncbi:hypothetical protein [Paractinoplanes atraurantiacus]|uniref:hypothetical protein n=1 Tax=Paractinoplanes atraurantiacus TaxID=1036182 RepID=UPI000BE48069|nr:hypothetical protein [Actinoplanes atraurantiacus]
MTYQPFPNPRPAVPEQDTAPVPAPMLGPAPPPAPAAGAPEPRPSGRHTVPDELVQAKTYLLPPDRVFRAKVPDNKPLPEEPTTPLSVPKPRRS